LAAVHSAGHDHVGEQEIEFGALVDQPERRRAVAGDQRAIAELARLREALVKQVLNEP